VILSLAGSSTLIYALEQGSISQSWTAPSIIATLTSSAYLWLAFAISEVHLTYASTSTSNPNTKEKTMLPIFPVHLLRSRVIAATMLSGFLSGFAFFVIIVNIPQRYQIVNDLSSDKAGLRLIPLLIMSAFGAGFTGWLCARRALDFYVLVAACALQIRRDRAVVRSACVDD
jgi:hypothetical protein